MDLSILVVIFVGTLLSLLGLYFFLIKPLAGKSYEESMKEKREMREKILGPASNAKSSSSTKDNANKKTKKVIKKPQQQKPKAQVVKDSDQDSAGVESDSNSSESQLEEEINPLTYAKKVNTGVDYAETEAFPLGDHGKKKDKQNQGKKNKQKSGILLNKSEPVLVKQDLAPEINHFEEIHPKDALEIARQQKEEESKIKTAPKEQRRNKTKDHAKSSNKPVEEIAVAVATTQNTTAAPVVIAETKLLTSTATKDKSSKKKKNELITQQLAAEVQDAANVQSLVRILGKADLPRNDIQILIDFLLNKQQDTLTKDPSEWNDPSDPLQKLKKQLQDKQTQLEEELKNAAGLHAKLKELRLELNNEKSQASSVVKGYVEELNSKRLEVQSLNQQLLMASEKYAAEKQTLSHQFQQLQAKYVQLSEKHAAAQEGAASVAQLNENIQILQHELMTKGQLLNEKLKIEEDLLKKKTEYEILLRGKEEALQQRAKEISAYENDLQQLRLAVSQKDELNKTCQLQNFELEQLKGQIGDLQAKQKLVVAANNQIEEGSKVEIRNLQNALDSSKTELTGYRSELLDSKSKLADQEQQLQELRTREEDLQKQLQEQKNKNNELLTKSKNSSNHVAEPPAPKIDIDKVILEEQSRTKDLLIKLLPLEIVSALPLDAENFHSWLESTVTCIREQQQQQQQECVRISNTNNSNSTEVHLNFNNNTSRSSNSANNNSIYENTDAHDSKTEGGNNNKNGAPENSDPVEDQQALTLRNEQLQKTVDQYKIIIADTEIMLKNLEAKVIEQDIHWRSVVQAKEKELNLLKSAGALK